MSVSVAPHHLARSAWRLFRKGHPFHAVAWIIAVASYWLYAAVLGPVALFICAGELLADYLGRSSVISKPTEWLELYYDYLGAFFRKDTTHDQ